MIDWIQLDTGAEGAVALPAGRPRGSAVVASELFGITDYVTGILGRLAAAGYVAVAPDFYWRTERRVALGYDQAGRDRGFALMGTLDATGVIADVAAARSLVLERADGAAGVAMLGFSAGGHIGVLAATQMPFDLLGWFYGPWALHGGAPLNEPHPPLDDAENLARFETEVLGAVWDQDHVISQAEWTEIDQRLTAAGVNHRLLTYPGRPHGFLCPDRPDTYDPEATEDVWNRLLEALDRRVARAS